jgi:hypothetical protein
MNEIISKRDGPNSDIYQVNTYTAWTTACMMNKTG